MNRPSSCCLTLLVLVGGCLPQDPSARYQSTVVARIGISSTIGEPPLHVVVSGEQSASSRGPISKYIWDFAGQARSEEMVAEHTFSSPGRYPITLTVVDAAGEQGSARVFVRVRGGDVTAVIDADQLSGPAPLLVRFDGTSSTAVNDTILDYFWDFGDNEQSRQAAPTHVYNRSGSYTVTLRVISAGGLEGTAEATVTVGAGAGGASLQFNGGQFATLPLVTEEPLSAFTFEAWCNPDPDGGTLVNFGLPNVAIDVSPATGTVAVHAGGEAFDASLPLQAGRWQHLALSYWNAPNDPNDPNAVEDPNAVADPNSAGDPNTADTATVTVYVDGTPVATVSLSSGDFGVTLLSLGAGFRGKIAGVRFWSIRRSDIEIAADVNGTLTGFEEGLLGDWPLSAGRGQTLQNNADGGESGTLGASSAPEAADPAWSSDSP